MKNLHEWRFGFTTVMYCITYLLTIFVFQLFYNSQAKQIQSMENRIQSMEGEIKLMQSSIMKENSIKPLTPKTPVIKKATKSNKKTLNDLINDL